MDNQLTPQEPETTEPAVAVEPYSPDPTAAPAEPAEPPTPVEPETPEVPPADPTPPPAPVQAVASPKPRTSKAVIGILVLLVIAVLALGGAYYMQKANYDDASAKAGALQQQLDAAKAQVNAKKSTSTATVSPTTTPDLIPANVDTGRSDSKVVIDGQYKFSLNPTAVWIAYGTAPDKLDKTTDKVTSELGLGDPGSTYGEMSSSIDSTQLTAGATYYYEVAATINGKTQVSAVASFTADK